MKLVYMEDAIMHRAALADRWSSQQLFDEIVWGYNQLYRVGVRPLGFSSPEWKTSKKLYSVLSKFNFNYIADAHGIGMRDITYNRGLYFIPTNILGEPRGVDYLEFHATIGSPGKSIERDFNEALDRIEVNIMYDHPYFAGVSAIKYFARLLSVIKKRRLKIELLKDIV